MAEGLATLASDDWFSDSVGDLKSKDTAMGLRGNWIIEMGELVSIQGANENQSKAFITRRNDKIRDPYARIHGDNPRTNIFAGTTNGSKYLTDPTGGRRYWPAKVGTIDLNALKKDRDQLWAEAAAAYAKGEKWWLTETDEQAAKIVQAERKKDDPWQPMIEAMAENWDEISPTEILKNCIQVPNERLTSAQSKRVTDILTDLGWAQPEKPNHRYTSGPFKGAHRWVAN